MELKSYEFCDIKINSEMQMFTLFLLPSVDKTFKKYAIKEAGMYPIGSIDASKIKFTNGLIRQNHAILKYDGTNFEIEDGVGDSIVYVNNKSISKTVLVSGDSVFMSGLRFVIVNNNIYINNYNSSLVLSSAFEEILKKEDDIEELIIQSEESSLKLYEEGDYYFSSPRFRTTLGVEEIVIDSPPGKESDRDRPIILTIGPMLTMGMTAGITGFTTLNNYLTGKASLSDVLPSLIISGAMLLTMIVWPFLINIYEKHEKKKREKNRQGRYLEYLREKRKKIASIKQVQRQNMIENNLSPQDCQNIILLRKRNLWERKIDHEDFASFRVGEGNVPLKVKLNYSEERFALDDDNLRVELADLVLASKEITAVPISVSLPEKSNIVIIGEERFQKKFINNTILNLMTFHSYQDLKFVFMIENDNDSMWEMFKILPHTWNNEKDMRFFASNYEDMTKISFYLESIFNSRKYTEENEKQVIMEGNYKNYPPYYVIIVNNIKKTRNIGIISEILSSKNNNYGFSVLILNSGISNLPDECSNYIAVEAEKCAIMENDLNLDKQQLFKLDSDDGLDMYKCVSKLANIPIVFSKQNQVMANSVSFLSIYGVGNVEQLNAQYRWSINNPTNSLSAPIGINAEGEIFNLDLHEKFYGPHGLVAGMTGSGKSELLITYILSMAINFHPNDVSFVLIDYKGGGLAGAFQNKDLGVKLPHLSGVITNLDTIELNRSLVSIQSELRRRQTLFNKARDDFNEGTIDIYKYQKLYRDGVNLEPVSHLFIITDEFAELKSQRPEFMDQLISTARIGRSLGVHLILATQKPSGVVNDQIWSNSKFRISLKVQEKSDSMEVIKRPDAASLKNPGRFYIQVGYNDFFGVGQAAWAGEQYYPTNKLVKKIDTTLSFIDNLGDYVKSLDDVVKKQNVLSMGDELSNIVKYLTLTAEMENISIRPLWLEKISEEIYVGNLKEKYKYVKKDMEVNPIIGEYDDPDNQRQELLTLSLTKEGNTLIYGSAGNGKELLITTMIYSSIIEHSSKEINFYIMDFGAESLKVFKNAPQVGDIILVNDEEKVTNVFRFLSLEIKRRKDMMSELGVDYFDYGKSNKEVLPLIVIVINNYEVFAEVYESKVEELQMLSRDANRYGIVFVITVNGTSSMRYKVAQNFSQILSLQFNEDSDYMTLFGNLKGMRPSNIYGRGLFKEDKEIYEFQTAYPYKKEELNDYLKIVCSKLSEGIEFKAQAIKVLPDKVTYDVIKNNIISLENVPIGVDKNNLSISAFDFKVNVSSLISSLDVSNLSKFIPNLVTVLSNIANLNLVIIDAEKLLVKHKFERVNYFCDGFDEIMGRVYNTVNKYKGNESYVNLVFMIIGLDSLKSKITPENKDLLFKTIEESEELNVNYIICDSIDKIKLFEYESFYKNTVKNTSGIWVGMGLSEQYTIKVNRASEISKSIISQEFGVVIEKSEASVVKLIDFSEEDNE